MPVARRAPSAPPQIAGLVHRSLIGSGGFADVFLCTESALGRDVAVKVLAQPPSAEEEAAFRAEANVMAQLSSHGSIVQIFQVGTATDGRPYMSMELCPGPSFAERYRSAAFEVPEALEAGVRICAAVETAHRAGIIHRDIKPGNILSTAFGDPKLADFGISRVLAEPGDSAIGFSVPWSPPEVVGEDGTVDTRSDVWSLGATLYTVLAGRSPFEVPGAANDAAALISRILHSPLAPIGRPIVPASLDRVLAKAMTKRIDGRPASAMALARSLQEVQLELHLPATRIDVLDASRPSASASADDDDDDPGTSVRPITVIDLAVPSVVPPAPPRPAAGDLTLSKPVRAVTTSQPRFEAAAGPLPEDAAPAGTAASQLEPIPEPPGTPRGRRPLAWVVGAAIVVLAGVGAVSLLGGGDGGDQEVPTARLDGGSTQAPPSDTVVIPAPMTPTEVTGTLNGRTARFTWSQTDPQPGDTFRWTLAGDGGQPAYTLVDSAGAQVDVPPGRRACIVVTTVRSGQQSAPSPLSCAAGS
nr:serine/threonine-protein kinase [Nocardioides flavescens]